MKQNSQFPDPALRQALQQSETAIPEGLKAKVMRQLPTTDIGHCRVWYWRMVAAAIIMIGIVTYALWPKGPRNTEQVVVEVKSLVASAVSPVSETGAIEPMQGIQPVATRPHQASVRVNTRARGRPQVSVVVQMADEKDMKAEPAPALIEETAMVAEAEPAPTAKEKPRDVFSVLEGVEGISRHQLQMLRMAIAEERMQLICAMQQDVRVL